MTIKGVVIWIVISASDRYALPELLLYHHKVLPILSLQILKLNLFTSTDVSDDIDFCQGRFRSI